MWDETKHVPQNSRCKVAVHVAVVDARNGMGHRLRGFQGSILHDKADQLLKEPGIDNIFMTFMKITVGIHFSHPLPTDY